MPFIELKHGTGVINEACNPCSFSPSLFNRINHVTMMSVSTSPNFFLCGYMPSSALRSRTSYQLITDVIRHACCLPFNWGWRSTNHRCDHPHRNKKFQKSIRSKSGISPPSAFRSRASYLSDARSFASLKQQMAVCCLQSRN